MDWLHSYASLREHPKTRKLARTLGVNVAEAIGHLHCLWWWSMDYAPDGDLTDIDIDVIADAADWSGDPQVLIDALVGATKTRDGYGFLDSDGGLRIHDHREYIGRHIEKAADEAERKRRERASGKPSTVDKQSVHRTSTGHPSDGERSAHVERKKERKIERKSAGGREASPQAPPARAPIKDGTMLLCPDCGTEVSYNGDGKCLAHCPQCVWVECAP